MDSSFIRRIARTPATSPPRPPATPNGTSTSPRREIRAGLHTGEVDLRGDDVGGSAVHICARIMAAAGPGEILVSRTVGDVVGGSDIALEDRGTHTLWGVGDPWQLLSGQCPRSLPAKFVNWRGFVGGDGPGAV